MANDKEKILITVLARALDPSVETIWCYPRDGKIPYIELGGRQYRYNLVE